jgi:hypothetical protein
MKKIFVQIASYRDLQLIPTIEDMVYKSKNPNNLVFGICWQYGEDENINYFDSRENFRISKHHYTESKGLGWARKITNDLYDGEYYTLQIDSHHRFVKHWDEILLEDFNQALNFSKKPIITTYCTPFDPNNSEDTYELMPCLMSQYEFSEDKLLMSMPYYITDYKDRNMVIKSRTLSGHFMFTFGNFIKEVPYDPEIYFGGYTEETTMSLRAFTHGYDFYSPYRMVMWHEYTRNYRPKHWDDHGLETQTDTTSGERDAFSRNKTRQLFGQDDYGIDLNNEFGLGKERTLHDYEIYGGFDFKRCLIQDYTLKVKEPPNPIPWDKQFYSNSYYLECVWDLEFFKNFNFHKPKFLTLGILDSNNQEIYRKDFIDSDYINLETNFFDVEVKSFSEPKKIVMYYFDEEKGWSDRYERFLI